MAPATVGVRNPVFDVTPARLVRAEMAAGTGMARAGPGMENTRARGVEHFQNAGGGVRQRGDIGRRVGFANRHLSRKLTRQ